MNIAEHRLNIAHQLEELSEESLIEVEKLIALLKLKPEQKPKRRLVGCMKGLVNYKLPTINIHVLE